MIGHDPATRVLDGWSIDPPHRIGGYVIRTPTALGQCLRYLPITLGPGHVDQLVRLDGHCPPAPPTSWVIPRNRPSTETVKTWSWRRHRQPYPPGAFLDVIGRSADREQVAMVWVSQRGRSAPAAWAAGGPRSSRDATLVDEAAEIQEWHGAHEMGHIVLGRRRVDALPQFVPWLALIVTILGAANLASRPPQLWMVFAIAGVLSVFKFACIVIGAAAFARRTREAESAADQFAVDQGYPVTDQIVAWITEVEPQLTLAPAYGPWRTHPMPADRHHAREQETGTPTSTE